MEIDREENGQRPWCPTLLLLLLRFCLALFPSLPFPRQSRRQAPSLNADSGHVRKPGQQREPLSLFTEPPSRRMALLARCALRGRCAAAWRPLWTFEGGAGVRMAARSRPWSPPEEPCSSSPFVKRTIIEFHFYVLYLCVGCGGGWRGACVRGCSRCACARCRHGQHGRPALPVHGTLARTTGLFIRKRWKEEKQKEEEKKRKPMKRAATKSKPFCLFASLSNADLPVAATFRSLIMTRPCQSAPKRGLDSKTGNTGFALLAGGLGAVLVSKEV